MVQGASKGQWGSLLRQPFHCRVSWGPVAAKGTVLKTQSTRSKEAPPGKTTSWLLGPRQAPWEGLFLAAEAAGAGLVWPCCLAA